MAILSNVLLTAMLGLAGISSAHPLENQNWEVYTNELGYTTSRFKPGMEPGSEDYVARFGNETINLDVSPANALMRRDSNWRTEPYAGSTKMAYGCKTDIARTVLSKLHDACHDTRCDSGTSFDVEVKYPNRGLIESATVSFKATGAYPSGMKHAFIEAIQAEVIREAVEMEAVSSDYPGSSHKYVILFGVHFPECDEELILFSVLGALPSVMSTLRATSCPLSFEMLVLVLKSEIWMFNYLSRTAME